MQAKREMLPNLLNALAPSKFVLIQDNLEQNGQEFVDYILKRKQPADVELHQFVFTGCFRDFKDNKIIYHDFVSDIKGWNGNKPDFDNTLKMFPKNSIVFIDSLVHFIWEYGIAEVYKKIHDLINNTVRQVVTLLHLDLLDENSKIPDYFEHLSTLNLNLEPKFNSRNYRVTYLHKKTSGKIAKETEEYEFVDGELLTKPLQKIDPKLFVQQTVNQISPEEMTTFKISLNEREKVARDQLVLPYLPKESGQVFYQFDSTDDWDEEDPDDDLDI